MQIQVIKTTSKAVIISLLFASIMTYGQDKINDNYHFVVNGNQNQMKEKPFLGMELEFNTVRKYLNKTKTEFKESRLFTGDDNDFIFYKIVGGKWFYATNKKFKLLYDYNNKLGGTIKLNNVEYKVSFHKTLVVQENSVDELKITPKHKKDLTNHIPVFFFSQGNGIVMVETGSGTILVRDDFFRTKIPYDDLKKL